MVRARDCRKRFAFTIESKSVDIKETILKIPKLSTQPIMLLGTVRRWWFLDVPWEVDRKTIPEGDLFHHVPPTTSRSCERKKGRSSNNSSKRPFCAAVSTYSLCSTHTHF